MKIDIEEFEIGISTDMDFILDFANSLPDEYKTLMLNMQEGSPLFGRIKEKESGYELWYFFLNSKGKGEDEDEYTGLMLAYGKKVDLLCRYVSNNMKNTTYEELRERYGKMEKLEGTDY